MKKEDAQKLTNAQLIVLCNKRGVPEGPKEDMVKAISGGESKPIEDKY